MAGQRERRAVSIDACIGQVVRAAARCGIDVIGVGRLVKDAVDHAASAGAEGGLRRSVGSATGGEHRYLFRGVVGSANHAIEWARIFCV